MGKRKKSGSSQRSYSGYRSYMFRTKDPAINELRTVVEDANGKINPAVLNQIEKDSGVKVPTMRNWFFGKTIRPFNAGLEAVGRSQGYRRKWIRIRKNGHG